MVYICIFLLTSLLISLSENLNKHKKQRIGNVVALLSVMLISIFSAIRDVSVGTDVKYYLVGHFNRASIFKGNFIEYFLYMTSAQEAEPLYVALQYIGSVYFHNIHYVMFTMAFLTNGFIYLGLRERRNEINLQFGWIIYCLVFFNTSLNIMRQSCALSIVWYLTMAYSKRNVSWKKYIFLLLIATGFHRTALIVGPVLIIVFRLCNRGNKVYTRIMMLVAAFFPVLFQLAPEIISRLSFLPMKYQLYFDKLNAEQSSVILGAIIYLVPTVLLAVLYTKKNKSERRKIAFFIILGIASISSCIGTNLLISRISYYLTIFFIYSAPYTSKLVSPHGYGRKVYLTGITIWFFIMWYMNIIVYGYGETYPYIIGV